MKTGNVISETPELRVYEASHLSPPPPHTHTHTHAPPRNNDFPYYRPVIHVTFFLVSHILHQRFMNGPLQTTSWSKSLTHSDISVLVQTATRQLHTFHT